jgi:hypothetical protein
MAAHPEMRDRPASIFVADVAFADIARQDDDLYRRVECASLAPGHDCNYPMPRRHLGTAVTSRPQWLLIGLLSSGVPLSRSGFRRPSAHAPVLR